ncbi:TIGR03759 family integrating conjugative element protein [Chitinimonas lacunae]|uniref:TIGR03759 family integrating conjugative element protein n=1 Tax=Chitinimonas lacunae TaxID=1963018 RepID=A0ABV8MV46_9NEIS
MDRYRVVCLGGCLIAAVEGYAQSPPTDTVRAVESRTQVSAEATSDAHQARDWGLRPDEWARYRQLMQGPLGVYSPNLDPLTALGIEARTNEERRRYAELQVQAEARRVEKLLSYQRAYDAAWQRLFPDLQRMNGFEAPRATTVKASPARLAVFVKADCPPCVQRVQQLQAAGTAFDVYFVDSRPDDARIRQWATQAAVDPAKVRARTITLNHDAGRWQSLGLTGDLPAVVREVNGQWQRQ